MLWNLLKLSGKTRILQVRRLSNHQRPQLPLAVRTYNYAFVPAEAWPVPNSLPRRSSAEQASNWHGFSALVPHGRSRHFPPVHKYRTIHGLWPSKSSPNPWPRGWWPSDFYRLHLIPPEVRQATPLRAFTRLYRGARAAI